MAVKCIDVMKKMEEWAPKSFAEDWDNTGLTVGRPEALIKKILVALDVTDEVIKEAVDAHADMIITHHPMIFHPIRNITADTAVGSKIHELIKHDISAYAAHTNLDVAVGGTNDVLADLLGLKNLQVLQETCVDQNGLPQGIGRIGELPEPKAFSDFAAMAKERLGLDSIRLVGRADTMIRRVGLCTGSGAEFLETAKRQGADAYITGDIKYHEAQRALEMDICIVDATHFASEVLIVPVIAKYLEKAGWDICILQSSYNGQVFWHQA